MFLLIRNLMNCHLDICGASVGCGHELLIIRKHRNNCEKLTPFTNHSNKFWTSLVNFLKYSHPILRKLNNLFYFHIKHFLLPHTFRNIFATSSHIIRNFESFSQSRMDQKTNKQRSPHLHINTTSTQHNIRIANSLTYSLILKDVGSFLFFNSVALIAWTALLCVLGRWRLPPTYIPHTVPNHDNSQAVPFDLHWLTAAC